MYGSIVVGTDGSDTAREAVRQAAELAKAVGADVFLVSAYEPVSEARLRQERRDVPEDVSWVVNPREDVQAVLDEEAERVRGIGIAQVETFAREGDPADAILDVAEEKGSDLI
ncbi:MAG: universal stress protein, partial [Thermoleophilaceae bacterium]